ncbi:MAG: O-antigen ligase family protein [Candidatus Moraniibacteriota bacterium]
MTPPFVLPFGWSVDKWLLVLCNMLAGTLLIVLSHTTALPLDDINLIFFSFVGFLFALYRPGWAFLLLIGMLPYEIINLAPANYPLTLRPYQWLLVLITLALLVRTAFRRFPLEKFVPNIWDAALVLLSIGAWLSALASDQTTVALKLSVILLSFVLLYFITRLFVRSIDDARMLLPFIFSTFLIIAAYAIVQNVLFQSGQESFEVMAGRPNATFAEADWLGGYLAAVLVVLSALIASPALIAKNNSTRLLHYIFSTLLFLGFVALLITVSRSAWLATLCGMLAVLFLYAWKNGVWRALFEKNRAVLQEILRIKLSLLAPLFLAFFLVYFSGLSPFDLFDRSRSTATGEQRITVACEKEIVLPEKIARAEALRPYGCEHIRLEEVAARQEAGEYVAEVFRDDPNVYMRREIYGQVTDILREHAFFGIGFGNIASLLGTDERGAGLNASNIFLEVWLGAGIIGFLAFLFFWFGLGATWLYRGFQQRSALTIVLAPLWITLTVFNLFNSGLFLGFFFACMACLLILPSHERI